MGESRVKVAVRVAAAQWMGSQLFGEPEPIVDDDVSVQWISYIRQVRQIAGRHLEWTVRPYSGKTQPTAAPVAISQLSGWEEDPTALASKSRHYAHCAGCSGEGTCTCSDCSGTAEIHCDRCGGLGRERSEKTGNPINCKLCKGKGGVKCVSCEKGRACCGDCAGSGVVEKWLEISHADDIQVEILCEHGMTYLTKHPGLRDRVLESREWRGAETVQRSENFHGPIERGAIGTAPPTNGEAKLGQDKRVMRELVEVFRAPLSKFTGKIGGSTCELAFFGSEPALVEVPRPATRSRFLSFCAVALVLMITVLGASYWFSGRDAFFAGASSANFSLGLSLIGIGALLSLRASFRQSSSIKGKAVGGALVAVGAIVAALVIATSAPSIASAQEHYNTGAVKTALTEVLAIRRLEPPTDDLAKLHAEIVLSLSLGRSSEEASAMIASLPADSFSLPTTVDRIVHLHMKNVIKLVQAESLQKAGNELGVLLDDAKRAGHAEIAANVVETQVNPLLSGDGNEGMLAVTDRHVARLPTSTRKASAIAHLSAAGKCGKDLRCRVGHLGLVRSAQKSAELAEVIASTVTAETENARALLRKGGTRVEKIRALRSARPIAELLSSLASVSTLEAEISKRREDVLADVHLLGAHFDVISEVVGAALLERVDSSTLRVKRDDMKFILVFNSKDRSVGAYLSANETERGSLVLEEVQKVAQELTGKEISRLKPQKRGIRFTRLRSGGHRVDAGWDGSRLVEVTIGEFSP